MMIIDDYVVYVCDVEGCTYVPAHVCKSEDNAGELLLYFHLHGVHLIKLRPSGFGASFFYVLSPILFDSRICALSLSPLSLQP